MRIAVALAVVCGSTLAGAAGPAASTLEVRVTPSLIRLAEGGRARIRVASAEAPHLSASVGRIESLRSSGSGVWEAEYVPPDDLDPHVVLITATAPAAFGWARLQLAGTRELEISAPFRTPVSVTAGDKVFGPVRADATGRALVRVDVPPGVRHAVHAGRKLELSVPQRGFALVVVEPRALEASASAVVTVRALAFNHRGDPVPAGSLKLRASEGVLSSPKQVEPGVFQATWSVEPGRAREAQVVAEISSPTRYGASGTLRRVPGPPRGVEIEVDREVVVAGVGDVLTVTGRVVDAAGNPTDAPANLVVSVGNHVIHDAVLEWRQSGGVHVGRVLVPRERSGQQQLDLKVIAPGSLVATRSVALVPGPPSVVRIEAEEQLFADGHDRTLRVSVLDQHGNRAEPTEPVLVTASHGAVGRPARHALGVYHVPYRSPVTSADYSDVIRAQVGPLEGQAEVRVRSRGGAVVVAPKAAFAMSSGGVPSSGGAAEIGLWTPRFGPSLGLVLEARYFTSSDAERAPVAGRLVALETGVDFLALDAALAWRRPFAHGMLWIGAGGGGARTRATVSVPGQKDLSLTSWVPSAHASVSWGLPLGRGAPFAELRLGWHGELPAGPVRGSLESVTFGLGYRLNVL